MTNPLPPKQLPQLIDDWCDGTITSADAELLDQLLADDENARREFLRCTELHGLLLSGDDAFSDTQDPVVPAKLNRWLVTGRRYIARPTPLSLSVAAVTIVLIVAVMAVMAPPFYRATVRRDVDPPAPIVVAELTSLYEPVWTPGQTRTHVGDPLAAGDLIQLSEGLAEVTYKNGATVVLEGPVSYRLHDARLPDEASEQPWGSLGRLSRGKLTAQLNGTPRGLGIETPWGAVLHVGTEFGMSIDAQRTTDIAVFQGEVELRRDASDLADQLIARVAQGESASISFEGNVVADPGVEAAKFVRAVDYLRLRRAKPAVMLWRFDDAEHLGSDSQNAVSLQVVGDAHYVADGRYGGTLALDGDGDMLAAAENLMSLPVGNSRYTVAAWIKPNQLGARGIVGWGEYGTPGRTNALRLGEEEALKHYWWSNDLAVSHQAVADADVRLDAGEWTHVAVTWDRQMRRFYLNGRLIALDQPETGPLVTGEQFAIGRTAPENAEFFSGQIDDVAIFRIPLNSAGIARVMKGDFRDFTTAAATE